MLTLQRTALRTLTRAAAAAPAQTGVRFASTKTLHEAVAEIVPEKQEQLKLLKSQYSQASLGEYKVENLIGGMRGLKSLLWEGSLLDAEEGIRFNGGLSIPDCEKQLPTAKDLGQDGKEMVPEAMLWLLLTGKVPSVAETKQLSDELNAKGKLPSYLEKVIDSFPKTMHPMTQLASAVASLNHDSAFAAAYNKGIKKTEYWQPTLEDSVNLIAKIPNIAARIYYNVFGKGKSQQEIDPKKDWIGNYCSNIGYDNVGMVDYLRLYIAIHGDHEGGNVSAHTTHLVGSALSDPYLSYAAGLLGLAGPLHGLANQEVLGWNLAMQKAVGESPSNEQVKEYLWSTLKSGRVVPGYGHAVLRKPDPRFSALYRYSEDRPELKSSSIVKLVRQVSQIAPDVLKEHGKTKNPFPNVDAASGCILYEYGMTEFTYYTVVFGISRALGALPALVMSRALGLPIERPKSMTMDAILKLVQK